METWFIGNTGSLTSGYSETCFQLCEIGPVSGLTDRPTGRSRTVPEFRPARHNLGRCLIHFRDSDWLIHPEGNDPQ